MDNILHELYYGNINPNQHFFNKQSEFGRAMKVLTDKETELLAVLNDEEKEVLQRYINAQMEVNSLTAVSKFLYGFKLGFQIAVEASKEVSYDEN